MAASVAALRFLRTSTKMAENAAMASAAMMTPCLPRVAASRSGLNCSGCRSTYVASVEDDRPLRRRAGNMWRASFGAYERNVRTNVVNRSSDQADGTLRIVTILAANVSHLRGYHAAFNHSLHPHVLALVRHSHRGSGCLPRRPGRLCREVACRAARALRANPDAL